MYKKYISVIVSEFNMELSTLETFQDYMNCSEIIKKLFRHKLKELYNLFNELLEELKKSK